MYQKPNRKTFKPMPYNKFPTINIDDENEYETRVLKNNFELFRIDSTSNKNISSNLNAKFTTHKRHNSIFDQ